MGESRSLIIKHYIISIVKAAKLFLHTSSIYSVFVREIKGVNVKKHDNIAMFVSKYKGAARLWL